MNGKHVDHLLKDDLPVLQAIVDMLVEREAQNQQ